nr:MAG TPA: hypothetical protein [Caudoviricetes sp.]
MISHAAFSRAFSSGRPSSAADASGRFPPP